MKRKQTQKTDISSEVKKVVWKRDGGRCIICGSTRAGPWCHFVPRSHGGLGVEKNVVTLCERCHREYDQTERRELYREAIRAYLQSCYPDWDESKLVYRKGV
jgi:5-methylcytosine-specific restriction endonuclease McrA